MIIAIVVAVAVIVVVVIIIVIVIVVIIIVIVAVVVVVFVTCSFSIKPQKLKVTGDLGLGYFLKRMRKARFVVSGTINTRNHFH